MFESVVLIAAAAKHSYLNFQATWYPQSPSTPNPYTTKTTMNESISAAISLGSTRAAPHCRTCGLPMKGHTDLICIRKQVEQYIELRNLCKDFAIPLPSISAGPYHISSTSAQPQQVKASGSPKGNDICEDIIQEQSWDNLIFLYLAQPIISVWVKRGPIKSPDARHRSSRILCLSKSDPPAKGFKNMVEYNAIPADPISGRRLERLHNRYHGRDATDKHLEGVQPELGAMQQDKGEEAYEAQESRDRGAVNGEAFQDAVPWKEHNRRAQLQRQQDVFQVL
ncbi:hypothetical protein BKA70DRAFT_1228183 [Coprinopsis sp. MPI-PUGE-AT-0042]|nr:hypothetical protein BKA70DRAFT_1228183 [Coprinopsis sp. MPI-PUGE-AT-0042]